MFAPPARAAGGDPPAYDPEAMRWLQECAAVYQGMKTYSDDGSLQLSMKINGQLRTESSPMTLAFQRPNKIKLCMSQMRLFSDGEKLVAAFDFTRKYAEGKVPSVVTTKGLLETPIGAAFLAGTSGIPPHVMLSLLADKDPVATALEGTVGLMLFPGEPQTMVLVRQKRGPDVRLLINNMTKRLDGIRLILQPEQYFGRIPPGITISEMDLVWSPNPAKVSLESLSPEVFHFTPPDKFERVGTLVDVFSAGQGKGSLVGRPAPEFQLDASGRTTPVHTSDLSGKVAVLIFWATWSPPCFEQLADMQRIVDRYRREGVVLVAINLDDEPSDLAKIQDKIKLRLQEHKLDLSQCPSVTLAFDPTNRVAMDYQIQQIPTTIIIDRKGIVCKHFIGHLKESSEALAKEIESLISQGQ